MKIFFKLSIIILLFCMGITSIFASQTNKQSETTMLWLTDIHADKKSEKQLDELYHNINQLNPDLICITGDIADGEKAHLFLENLFTNTNRPIAFVLGNHDFYGWSMEDFQQQTTQFSHKNKGIIYLSDIEGLQFGNDNMIIGIDNWNDLTEYNLNEAPIRSWDFDHIEDFKGLSDQELINKSKELAAHSCKELEAKLQYAYEQGIKNLYIAMHFAPYHSSHYYSQEILNNEKHKYYWSCSPIGKIIDQFANEHPEIHITILSGHTHAKGEYQAKGNVEAFINPSYGKNANTGKLFYLN